MRRRITAGLVVFAFAFLAFELSVNGRFATDHPTSFVQLDYSIWSNHSVALSQVATSHSSSVDDFHHGGMNYSALAPGTAFLALPFLAVAFMQDGGFTVFGPALFWSETFVSLMAALAVYLVYKTSKLYFRPSTSAFLAFAFGFSTIAWPFATYFFQSDVSAALVLLAAYLGVRASREDERVWLPSVLAGVAAGAAFTVDYVNLALFPVLGAFLALAKRGSITSAARSAGAFALGTLPGLATIAGYNLAIFGSALMTTEQAYLGQSSVFGSFTTPLGYGLALDLFSLERGLFVFAPFMVFGIMGMVDGMRTRGRRLETLLFLSLFLAVLLPYSAWYGADGGLSYGPRFIVAAMPFILIPAGHIVDAAGRKGVWVLFAVYLAGAAMNGMAAIVTAIPPITKFGVSPYFSYILPNFQGGNFDTFWASAIGRSWIFGGAFVVALGGIVPGAWLLLERRKEGRLGQERLRS